MRAFKYRVKTTHKEKYLPFVKRSTAPQKVIDWSERSTAPQIKADTLGRLDVGQPFDRAESTRAGFDDEGDSLGSIIGCVIIFFWALYWL